MNMKVCRFIFLLFLLVICNGSINAQENLSQTKIGTYDEIINLLFPLDVLDRVGNDVEFAFVLRVNPSFGIETQITIAKKYSGDIEVLEYQASAKSIHEQLNDEKLTINLNRIILDTNLRAQYTGCMGKSKRRASTGERTQAY